MRIRQSLNSILLLVLTFMVQTATIASQAACQMSEAGLFFESDVVVTAQVTSSKKWREGQLTVHLVAKYRVEQVFKGELNPGEILIVTNSCLDTEVPEEVLGYPAVNDYCHGNTAPSLTGVKRDDGLPVAVNNINPSWILFLEKNPAKGTPQTTWLEISKTGYDLDVCHYQRSNLSESERSGFDRMIQRKSELASKIN